MRPILALLAALLAGWLLQFAWVDAAAPPWLLLQSATFLLLLFLSQAAGVGLSGRGFFVVLPAERGSFFLISRRTPTADAEDLCRSGGT